ncbi:hypothetical protein PT974_01523 [Cladobotryum mycophilum]|uniref:F-box domain-containing protein n=1 Tax=Cladobotryum mycophilum TaxID=491253 RepID=A0ABR0T401_9HYPO
MRLVRDSLRHTFNKLARSDLGTLSRLPLEVLSLICLNLDIQSHFRFRQVNRRAREVSNVLQYQLVAEHGLQALHGLLLTQLAPYYTILDLYEALLIRDCTVCGSFGGFMFLLTGKKCCFECIKNAAELRIISLSGLSKAKNISSEILSELIPVLHTTSGIYALDEVPVNQSMECVSELQAINTLRMLGLWQSEANRVRVPTLTTWRYMAAVPLPHYDPETGLVEKGASCKGCHVKVEGSPYIDLDDRDKVYSMDGFLEHFQHCVDAQILYDESQGGTVCIEEPEFTLRGGYLSDYGLDGMPR